MGYARYHHGTLTAAYSTIYVTNQAKYAPCRAHLGRPDPSAQPVHGPPVAGEDLLGALLRQAGREGAEGVVEVPVRVVGGEQQPVPADPFHGVEQVLAVLRLLHGYGRDPDVLADVFRRVLLEVRHLRAHPLEELVEPPGERRQPGKATLHHHHLQLREALEHAFDDQARYRRLARGRMPRAFLDVVGGPG